MQVVCHICRQVNYVRGEAPQFVAYCGRCSAMIYQKRRAVIAKTLFFSVAALTLYVPANVLPILSMEKFGVFSENTIWSGCAALLENGYWGIALLVFVASILVPLLKLMGLFYLCMDHRNDNHRLYKTYVYRVVHAIGPWSMLDVFLVSILVALVKLGDLASVSAQPGLVAFAGVVVFTMFASSGFDPQLIWSGGES